MHCCDVCKLVPSDVYGGLTALTPPQTAVMVMSLGYICFVTLLHIIGKVRVLLCCAHTAESRILLG